MKSVFDLCQPRPELLAGTLNPEIFTASLDQVMAHYCGCSNNSDSIYTDAELFFTEATHPTQGLCSTLREVFARIGGDMTVPAIHRLETAFGGGKTHTLIACTHIAFRGQELQAVTRNIINEQLLPVPGSVDVVGIAGEKIPVHKPKGDTLEPYTLWGEIAYQIGGESLYRQVEDEANSYAAPGQSYFDKVFAGRKVLLMLDELAQYAARLEAARTDGADQLAAFLMALSGYIRYSSGIAVVLTLASSSDAFAKQTQKLTELVSAIRGDQVDSAEALGIGEKAVKNVASVVARDAVQITPVQATEISSVIAKRLFAYVDREGARQTVDEYMDMYRRNSSSLPEEATNENFRNRLLANYPFHPTLIDFLNHKLAAAENFQGTRGVLRVLSSSVHQLWQKQQFIPMIHTCHLDLRAPQIVNEVLGRTGTSDLLFVLNADVGGVDTGSLEGGYSNAQLADQRNPHPEGYPLYEYTWKTVFLHSLVGGDEGLNARIFGITEPEALFSVSFPGLVPAQVRMALEEIDRSAFYLRCEQQKYFASTQPTINSVLARIRKTITGPQINTLIADMARKVITSDSSGLFEIEHDVSLPEHIPDRKGKPVLGIVSPVAESIDVRDIVTTKGAYMARQQQNLVFLLVPDSVTVTSKSQQLNIPYSQDTATRDNRQRLEFLAREVKALSILASRPQDYGVNPKRLQEDDFKERKSGREKDLETAVARSYTSFYYPSAENYMEQRDIKTAGGEGGTPFLEQIRQILLTDGQLLTSGHTEKSDLLGLHKLFFQQSDTVSLATLQNNFQCLRGWPVLERPEVLEQIVRAGVQKGAWCVYRMGAEENSRPEEFYCQDNPLPLQVALTQSDYSLVTTTGANQRGWTLEQKLDQEKLKEEITYVVQETGTATLQEVSDSVREKGGEISTEDFNEAVVSLIKKNQLYVSRGAPEQQEKPELIHGTVAALYTAQSGDVLITPAKAIEFGWINEETDKITLSGKKGAAAILPLLRRLGSIYSKGGKCTIDLLDLVDLKLPAGGRLRLQISEVPPESMQALGELFEVLDAVVEQDENTEADLEITNPADDCPLIQALKTN